MTEVVSPFLEKGAEFTYVNPNSTFMVLDFETTNLDKGDPLNADNQLVLACWDIHTAEGVVRKHRFGDEYDMQELLDDINEVDFLVAQFSKFEMQWLKRIGLELRDVLVYDTMLGAWVLDGNRSNPRNLDALADRYNLKGKQSLVSALIKAGVCPSVIKREWLLEYCEDDLSVTYDVFVRQRLQLQAAGQLHLVHTRNLTAAVLADIEFEGLVLDPVAVQEEYAKVNAQLLEAGEKLYELTGGINMSSPKQVSEYLFETLKFKIPRDHRGKEMLTGKGVPSTAAAAIAALKPTNAKQREFLQWYEQYNTADTLLSKTLTFMLNVCKENDCKFYGSFNLGIAGTHRLTSSGRPILFKGEKKPKGIQLQNIPRQYKRLFWSGHEDWLVAEGDGAQLEFRVAADLGRDAVAMQEIKDDADVHTVTADFLLEHGYPGFAECSAKDRRQESKQYTFKPLYGGKSGHSSVVEYCQFFTEKSADIARTQGDWAFTALQTGKQVTPYGMVFYWPGTTMSRSGYISNTTQIYNYPVQGFATGEIIPIALIHFWHRSRNHRIRIFTTIHDSIGVYVHKDETEICKELFKVSLTDDVFRYLRDIYNYEFITPLGVGAKVSRNWGVADKESIWNVNPDGTYTFKEK